MRKWKPGDVQIAISLIIHWRQQLTFIGLLLCMNQAWCRIHLLPHWIFMAVFQSTFYCCFHLNLRKLMLRKPGRLPQNTHLSYVGVPVSSMMFQGPLKSVERGLDSDHLTSTQDSWRIWDFSHFHPGPMEKLRPSHFCPGLWGEAEMKQVDAFVSI